MDFELKLAKPKVSRAWISAATMGVSYFTGELALQKDVANANGNIQGALFP